MKIVHVSYSSPERLGGGQGVVVWNLCRNQAARGRSVSWITPCLDGAKPGRRSYLDGRLEVVYLACPGPQPSNYFAHDYEAQLARERFGDCFVGYLKGEYSPAECRVHLHGFIEVPRRAADLARAGFHCVSTFHMLLSTRIEATGESITWSDQLRAREEEAVSANSRIIVNSAAMFSEIRRRHRGPAPRIELIPNGIDDECFDTAPLALRETPPLVSSFGRISPEKGFDLFLRAAALLTQRRGPIARFLVFGQTADRVAVRRAYKEELVSLAAGYDNITLDISDDGMWSNDRLLRLDRTSIGVAPARYEPFGLTTLEMMSRGLPVVTTLTDGAQDFLNTTVVGETDVGVAVASNPESIAGGIESLLDHPERQRTMGLQAATRSRKYRWDAAIPRIEDLYQ